MSPFDSHHRLAESGVQIAGSNAARVMKRRGEDIGIDPPQKKSVGLYMERQDNIAYSVWEYLDGPEEPPEDPSDPSSDDEDEAERERRYRREQIDRRLRKSADATRAHWRRCGRTTRTQYNLLKTAIPMESQDEIVALRKDGYTKRQIVDHMRGRVTEYAVKRVLRIYAYDPEAFATIGDDIVVLKK